MVEVPVGIVLASCTAVGRRQLSNRHGHLVLTTGNKSELAVGYSTIYGDVVGGFAPIKDVPKWTALPTRTVEAESTTTRTPLPHCGHSVDQLRARQPAAVQLLGLCAYLAPEPIPSTLFTDHPQHLPRSQPI